MDWLNGNLRLGIEPGFEALPLDIIPVGNPFPASTSRHAQPKVLRQRWTEGAEAPGLFEHKDVPAASVVLQRLSTVNTITLPDETTAIGRFIEVVRYLGAVRLL